MKRYSIDSFGWFPCETCKDFYELRKHSLKNSQILWYNSGIGFSETGPYNIQSSILIFLN